MRADRATGRVGERGRRASRARAISLVDLQVEGLKWRSGLSRGPFFRPFVDRVSMIPGPFVAQTLSREPVTNPDQHEPLQFVASRIVRLERVLGGLQNAGRLIVVNAVAHQRRRLRG